MSIFAWLLLGHLIGDWMLQSDWMAVGKRRQLFTVPGIIHCIVYTTVIMITLMLAGIDSQHYMWLTLFVFISHLLIDGTQLVDMWLCLFRQQNNRKLMRLVNDQIFHLIILAVIAEYL